MQTTLRRTIAAQMLLNVHPLAFGYGCTFTQNVFGVDDTSQSTKDLRDAIAMTTAP